VLANLIGMARPARHRIELGEVERSELERIARAEKRPWREVQRARIVLYAADGRTDVEIAARLDTSAGIVGRWRRRFHAERLEGLKDRPRVGRPRRLPRGAGRRGQGGGLRVARHSRRAALGLQLY
jgi:Helix-turn-helix domain